MEKQKPVATIRNVPPMENLFQKIFSSVLAFFWLGLLGVLALSINVLQMLSLLVRPFSSALFRKINLILAYTFWKVCLYLLESFFNVEVILSGDPTPAGENVILFSNHQQMPDILALMPLADRNGRLRDMKWFAKDPIKYFPGIGWGMLFLDCIFLKRDWTADASRVRRTFARLLSHGSPFWLVSFSEGTRITPAKLRRSQEFAERMGLPRLEHVLIPRTRGFIASVGALRERTQAVYDVTIGYEPGIATLWQFLQGRLRKVHVHVRRFPISELPLEEKALADWLMQRFQEKDLLMAHFSRQRRMTE